MNNTKFRLSLLMPCIYRVVYLLLIFTPAFAQDVGRTQLELRYGVNDVDTPDANTVVWINGCTGTLLTPSIVVSAGHCFRPGAPLTEDSRLVCSDKEVPGRWYPVVQTIQIRVGYNRTSPRFNTIATEYNLPGCADIVMFRLARSVPTSIAKPSKVIVSIGSRLGARDSDYFRDKTLTMVGWGLTESSTTPIIRQIGVGEYVRHDDGMMFIRGNRRVITDSGDSGGPLFWKHPSGQRYLIGILQGPTPSLNENRYTPTFRKTINGRPGVGYWFRTVVPSAVYCDGANNAPEGTLPLVSWWSPGRKDNFITTDARWCGCKGTIISPDYRFVRTEGYIFNPTLSQPKGTVRLYSWYDPDRGDNFATTHPMWIHWEGDNRHRSPNYRLVRLEGYIFDPELPQPTGTIPLYRWYSGERGDNYTTAAFGRKGRRGEGLGPNYGRPRLMGYVFQTR